MWSCFTFYQIFRQLGGQKNVWESEDLSLNPVEISVEATQTTLEKLKIINNHILSVAVRPSSLIKNCGWKRCRKNCKKTDESIIKKNENRLSGR